MARTRARPRGTPSLLETSYLLDWHIASGKICDSSAGSAQRASVVVGPPTERSASLLLSFPLMIFAEIFRFVLADDLSVAAFGTSSLYDYIPLSVLVRLTKPLREVCQTWTIQLREAVFAGRAARSGMLALVELRDVPFLQATFPHINHCLLELGSLFDLASQEQNLRFLQSLEGGDELDPITAVTWTRVGIGEDCPRRLLSGYMAHRQLMNLTDNLDTEVSALYHYNAHLIRVILSLFSKLDYLEIPSHMFLTLLGAPPDYGRYYSRRAIAKSGDSILSILQAVGSVQFIGPSNPFICSPEYYYSSDLIESELGPKLYAICEQWVQNARLPDDLRFSFRNVGISETIATWPSSGRDDKWLNLLKQFCSGSVTKKIHFTQAKLFRFNSIGGPMDLSIYAASKELHAQHISHPRIHLCEELSNRDILNTQNLGILMDSICPMFFHNARKVRGDVSGKWRIVSAPRICPQWFALREQPADTGFLYDLAVVQELIEAARPLTPKVDMGISLAYTTRGTRLWALQLYPGGRVISYTRGLQFNYTGDDTPEGSITVREFDEDDFYAAVKAHNHSGNEVAFFPSLDRLEGGKVTEI